MNDLSKLETVSAVDDFIDHEICRNTSELRAKAESGDWTDEERVANPKLDAVLKALEWRAELQRGVLP